MTTAELLDLRDWARGKCEEVVHSSRLFAVDGTVLFTPDGVGQYGALWTRDFAYLVEHGSEFLTQQEVREAIRVIFAAQRQDGAMPDRVNTGLVPFYHPGNTEHPMGAGPALDNGMFAVALVYHYHRYFDDRPFVDRALPTLRRALAFVPRNRGLVFNDPQKPSCTYGFQDTVAKGGHDLFCSLLWIVACRQMAELDLASADQWRNSATSAEEALGLLWDDHSGAYFAADEVCRQVDVWGNTFLVAHQIGDKSRRDRVAHYLAENYEQFVYAGQVRHLSGPTYWERLFDAQSEGIYQNGGYWGTPSGWLIKALEPINSTLAKRTFGDLMDFYRTHGVLEWSTPEGRNGPDLYVASILNVWSIIQETSAAE